MTFIEKLVSAWEMQNSLLCIGLDPDVARLPEPWHSQCDGIFNFCKAIIDASAKVACAFKPQIAYFAAARAEEQLEALCVYIRQHYAHIPIILDAKRGDIGATAQQYAREAFERYGAAAVTVNPYMGFDSVIPYLEWQDRGVFILCRTSNAGGADLQALLVENQPLYQHVAHMVAEKWNTNGQCGLVMGATFPNELAQVRDIVGNMPLLVPGIGVQGGDIADAVSAGKSADGTGMIINVARAILYAEKRDGETAIEAARRVAYNVHNKINQYRQQPCEAALTTVQFS